MFWYQIPANLKKPLELGMDFMVLLCCGNHLLSAVLQLKGQCTECPLNTDDPKRCSFKGAWELLQLCIQLGLLWTVRSSGLYIERSS